MNELNEVSAKISLQSEKLNKVGETEAKKWKYCMVYGAKKKLAKDLPLERIS